LKCEPEPEKDVKFPKRIKHRGRTLATIYGKSKAYPAYRVAWNVNRKRMMKAFPRYGEAKRHADELVKELAKGSQATALSAAQARDALAAFERLQSFYQLTGRRVSLLAAVSEFAESAAKLDGRSMGDAVDGFLSSVASVKRKDIKEAVGEFVALRKPLTEAKAGKRAQLSKGYAGMTALWLSAQAEAGNVKIVRGPWNDEFIRVLENFPIGGHDDEVDGLSLAHEELTGARAGPLARRIELPSDELRVASASPRGRILI